MSKDWRSTVTSSTRAIPGNPEIPDLAALLGIQARWDLRGSLELQVDQQQDRRASPVSQVHPGARGQRETGVMPLKKDQVLENLEKQDVQDCEAQKDNKGSQVRTACQEHKDPLETQEHQVLQGPKVSRGSKEQMAAVPVVLGSRSVAPAVQLGSPELQVSLELRGPLV